MSTIPVILHIETATDICSVCVSKGATICALKENKEGYSHAANITLLIEDCLADAGLQFSDLSAVSISQGPGSYTSLRVGTSAAKAICYACDIPLIPVDTLYSLARAARQQVLLEEPRVYSIPLIDARRMEVYTAVFDEQYQKTEATQAKIMDSNAFQYLLKPGMVLLFCGNGLEKCLSVLQHPQMVHAKTLCSASNLVLPALESFQNRAYADTAYFSPYYFKSPTITRSKKKIL